MKKPLVLLFLLVILPVISAAETLKGHEVEWEGDTSYTLSWTNPSISKGGYVIKVIDFNWKGNAAVSVTREGVTKNGILSQGENIIFDFTRNTSYFQGVKINAKTISNYLPFPTNIGTYPCCPAAEITVSVSKEIVEKKPALELVLSPNWDGDYGSISVMNFQIRNTGDASFSEGNITVNIGDLKLAKEKELADQALIYNPSRKTVSRGWSTPLSPGNSYLINLSLTAPFPINKSSFTISAQSFFKDGFGKVYPATASTTVSFNPTISLKKIITSSTILGDKTYGSGELDVGYLPKVFGIGKVTVVNLYITNIQTVPVKSIILTDTTLKDFILMNNTVSPTNNTISQVNDFRLINNTLQWVFELNASETKEFRYEMIAQKTGTFTAPAAVAKWNEWGVAKTTSSSQPSTRVYGVFLVISKKTDQTRLKVNESFNVTATLENIGDFPVGINVTDVLPKNTTFLSGTASYSGFLYPRESVILEYNLSAYYPEELEVPSPQVTFWKKEYEGAYGAIPAGNLTVFEPSAVLPAAATVTQTAAPATIETPLPKSLLDIAGEKAPWLEGAIPIIMLFIAIILMLMLHVVNR